LAVKEGLSPTAREALGRPYKVSRRLGLPVCASSKRLGAPAGLAGKASGLDDGVDCGVGQKPQMRDGKTDARRFDNGIKCCRPGRHLEAKSQSGLEVTSSITLLGKLLRTLFDTCRTTVRSNGMPGNKNPDLAVISF
jgi:hypothetical protein